MKKAIILHGTNGNSKENWYPWLKKELEKLNWKVWIPDLPLSHLPNIKRYNKFLLKNLLFEIDNSTSIIGHSSGSLALLGLLSILPRQIKINHAILISTFKDNTGWKNLDGLFETPFNFNVLRTKSQKYTIIHSDNDPFCPLEHAKYMAKMLNGILIIKKNQAHFTYSTHKAYKKFPFLLNLLNKSE